MNIVYLCGSAQSRGHAERLWLDANQAAVEGFDRTAHRGRLINGVVVYFCTYDNPDLLRGMEIDMVIEDGERIAADYRQAVEIRGLIDSRLARHARPVRLKNPPAV